MTVPAVAALSLTALLCTPVALIGIRVVYTLCMWKAGRVPPFRMRRIVIRFIERTDETRPVLDVFFGAQLVTAIYDKKRRRGMAVWRVRR